MWAAFSGAVFHLDLSGLERQMGAFLQCLLCGFPLKVGGYLLFVELMAPYLGQILIVSIGKLKPRECVSGRIGFRISTPRLRLFSKHCVCLPQYPAIKRKMSHWLLDVIVAGERVGKMLTWRPSLVILQGNPALESCRLVWG